MKVFVTQDHIARGEVGHFTRSPFCVALREATGADLVLHTQHSFAIYRHDRNALTAILSCFIDKVFEKKIDAGEEFEFDINYEV